MTKTFKQTQYSKKLLDPRWQKKRLEVLSRDKFKCVSCGNDKETLHVHHLSYKTNPWDVDNDQLETLCSTCHENEHFKEDEFTYEHENHTPVKNLTPDSPYIECLTRIINGKPLILSTDDLLNLTFDLQDYKYTVSTCLQWHYKELLKFESMTQDEFVEYNKTYKLNCSLQEWIEFTIQSVNEECYKEGAIILDKDRSFGEEGKHEYLIEESKRFYGTR